MIALFHKIRIDARDNDEQTFDSTAVRIPDIYAASPPATEIWITLVQPLVFCFSIFSLRRTWKLLVYKYGLLDSETRIKSIISLLADIKYYTIDRSKNFKSVEPGLNINMAFCLAPEQFDFSSVYTECCRLGCKNQVKRGEVCSCGMQN
ncbi:hypothetical protein HCDG_08168 [Histoplasma capsulatum H143]|uniref:Uncharacterized protein n=1 Tax=Ajellomyces capsulatus (strain H143) TaxID=544712 RepID=C6HPN7_AJECH|nr:hypothetical protein HCDG_08168 [Histoplasma capsulatum H143]